MNNNTPNDSLSRRERAVRLVQCYRKILQSWSHCSIAREIYILFVFELFLLLLLFFKFIIYVFTDAAVPTLYLSQRPRFKKCILSTEWTKIETDSTHVRSIGCWRRKENSSHVPSAVGACVLEGCQDSEKIAWRTIRLHWR